MKAILVTRANRETILDADTGIRVKDLDLTIEKYDSTNPDECIVFIFFRTIGGWAFITQEAFTKHFKPADLVQMRSDFVAVELKENA